jgi:hypothetical protein
MASLSTLGIKIKSAVDFLKTANALAAGLSALLTGLSIVISLFQGWLPLWMCYTLVAALFLFGLVIFFIAVRYVQGGLRWAFIIPALIFVVLAGCFVAFIPPKPIWTFIKLPLAGEDVKAPLGLIRGTLDGLSNDYPGTSRYAGMIDKGRVKANYADPKQQWVALCARDVTPNRLPTRIAVRDGTKAAIGVYIFCARSDSWLAQACRLRTEAWTGPEMLGFDKVDKEVSVTISRDSRTRYCVVAFVFPLDEKTDGLMRDHWEDVIAFSQDGDLP